MDDHAAQEIARAEVAQMEREAQERALEQLVELYLERNDNLLGEELSDEMLAEMLQDPETRPFVEAAFPDLRNVS